MASLLQESCVDMYDAWSKIIRFITKDNTVAGNDWEIVKRELDEVSANNVQFKNYYKKFAIDSLDTDIELDTISVYDFHVCKTSDKKTFVVATSDGESLTYSNTVSDTNLILGLLFIEFTISGVTYLVKDNGYGSFSSDYVTGLYDPESNSIQLTFSTPPDLGSSINLYYYTNELVVDVDYSIDEVLGNIKFLSTSTNIAVGDEVEYSYNFKREVFYLFNNGTTTTEKIYIALRIGIEKSGTFCNIGANIYQYFDESGYLTGWNDGIPFPSGKIPSLSIWNNNNTLWIFSTKDYIILVDYSNTKYSFLYVGNVLRATVPSDYPRPVFVSSDCYYVLDYSAYTNYTSEDSTRTSLLRIPFAIYSPFMYWAVNNDFGGSSDLKIIPSEVSSIPYIINYPVNRDVVLFPLYIYDDSKDVVYGTIFNCAWCLDDTITETSTITDGNGDTWIVFPDIDLVDFDKWLAIKVV